MVERIFAVRFPAAQEGRRFTVPMVRRLLYCSSNREVDHET
jgi:hypothetical protein